MIMYSSLRINFLLLRHILFFQGFNDLPVPHFFQIINKGLSSTKSPKPLSSICPLSSSATSRSLILGIETSCDDTGAAVVNSNGVIVGEALHSQLQTHLNLGGIIPVVARDLHKQNIAGVVETAMHNAKLNFTDLSAIAVTVRPGMALSLSVGTEYAKDLAKKWSKPLIPIHHMEAHALTARMVERVDFPFMVLLVSGGHCLLALVKSVDEFLCLGESNDNAPGEILDKAARRLKLRNLPAFTELSGGRALEIMARQGNARAFEFGHPMRQHRDCSFSFAGLRNKILKYTEREEVKFNTEPDKVVPNAADLCASFQHAIFAHICKRLQRGMIYVDDENALPKESGRTLVVSGGVACNQYFRSYLEIVCKQMGYRLVCPDPKLCTDNGIMIAWNGVERYKAGVGIAHDINTVDIDAKARLGVDISAHVRDRHIPVKWIKLLPPISKEMTLPNSNQNEIKQ